MIDHGDYKTYTNDEWERVKLRKELKEARKHSMEFGLHNLLGGILIGFCIGVFVVTNFGLFL